MIESFGVSDPGCVRTNNEDCFLLLPSAGLYVVADGMGGAQAGEHASRLAVETVRHTLEAAAPPTSPDDLLDAFAKANQRVMKEADSDQAMEGMGTTLVAAVEYDRELFIASVGDSRAYLFENGKLQPITEDQTWVNEVGRRLDCMWWPMAWAARRRASMLRGWLSKRCAIPFRRWRLRRRPTICWMLSPRPISG